MPGSTRSYRVYQIDAFTSERFAGNPAAVLPDARGLADAEMQAIAREMNNSETAFILPASEADHEVQIRFFTPTHEVPVCGHATVASHFVRALEGAGAGRSRQLTKAGILDIDIDQAGDSWRIWMHQKPAEFDDPLPPPLRERIAEALGLAIEQLGSEPVQVVSTGHSKVMVPVVDRAAVVALKPNWEALTALSREIGCNGYYPFTRTDCDKGIDAHARMFAPAIGILEDPVTGNAAGPLGAYLVQHGLASLDANDEFSLVVGQGQEIGRPGRVRVVVRREVGGGLAVRIAGDAVLVFRTEMVV